nr:Chain C, MM90 [Schaalia radingae]
YLVVVGAVGV